MSNVQTAPAIAPVLAKTDATPAAPTAQPPVAAPAPAAKPKEVAKLDKPAKPEKEDKGDSKHPKHGIKTDMWRMDPLKLVIVGLDKGYPANPADPLCDVERLHMLNRNDPEMKALIESIRVLGRVLQPGTMVKDGDVYKVQTGRRRVFALRLVNEERIAAGQEPLLVEMKSPDKGTEAEIFLRVIAENAIRADDTPMASAAKVQRAMGFLGMDASNPGKEGLTKIAGAYGVTVQAIRNWIALNNLAGPVRKMVEDGKLTASAALQLAPLGRDDQKAAADQMLLDANGGKVSTDAARGARNKKKAEKAGKDPEEVSIKPPIRMVNAVVRLAMQDKIDGHLHLDGSAFDFGRWVTGDLPAKKIKGLVELINRFEAGE